MRFPPSFLDTPIQTGDSGLQAILSCYAEDSLAGHKDMTSLGMRTRRLIAASLANGSGTIRHVAENLAMTPRTLQRKLADEGIRFNDLLDDTRRDLAVQYLNDPHLGLTEIAFLVGYSDLTAFHRAFRRWFDQTPYAFRDQVERR
jgi:AraC-like DNA-binding protein